MLLKLKDWKNLKKSLKKAFQEFVSAVKNYLNPNTFLKKMDSKVSMTGKKNFPLNVPANSIFSAAPTEP